jgi:hypothetical protein
MLFYFILLLFVGANNAHNISTARRLRQYDYWNYLPSCLYETSLSYSSCNLNSSTVNDDICNTRTDLVTCTERHALLSYLDDDLGTETSWNKDELWSCYDARLIVESILLSIDIPMQKRLADVGFSKGHYWLNTNSIGQYSDCLAGHTEREMLLDSNLIECTTSLKFLCVCIHPTFPTPGPTKLPTLFPTSKSPSRSPTRLPTLFPTSKSPSQSPTRFPTLFPISKSPSQSPTRFPTLFPTSKSPSTSPTKFPTSKLPSKSPSAKPSNSPTRLPTSKFPSISPTKFPTSKYPSISPSAKPSISPTKFPTSQSPSKSPSVKPSNSPTRLPTSKSPSISPTKFPTSKSPSKSPSVKPSNSPTRLPTSKFPSISPTKFPTSKSPSKSPSVKPSNSPTRFPTSKSPSKSPSVKPSNSPTRLPTSKSPSMSPTKFPTSKSPSKSPSVKPSNSPTSLPTSKSPSISPTRFPTSKSPSKSPSVKPSNSPTKLPTSKSPSKSPTLPTTMIPSRSPTLQPSTQNNIQMSMFDFVPNSTVSTSIQGMALSFPYYYGSLYPLLNLDAYGQANTGRIDITTNGNYYFHCKLSVYGAYVVTITVYKNGLSNALYQSTNQGNGVIMPATLTFVALNLILGDFITIVVTVDNGATTLVLDNNVSKGYIYLLVDDSIVTFNLPLLLQSSTITSIPMTITNTFGTNCAPIQDVDGLLITCAGLYEMYYSSLTLNSSSDCEYRLRISGIKDYSSPVVNVASIRKHSFMFAIDQLSVGNKIIISRFGFSCLSSSIQLNEFGYVRYMAQSIATRFTPIKTLVFSTTQGVLSLGTNTRFGNSPRMILSSTTINITTPGAYQFRCVLPVTSTGGGTLSQMFTLTTNYQFIKSLTAVSSASVDIIESVLNVQEGNIILHEAVVSVSGTGTGTVQAFCSVVRLANAQVTFSPTSIPTTLQPTTLQPTTLQPTTLQPTTLTPTKIPTTLTPTKIPTTLTPTKIPTTLTPTKIPTTLQPTTLNPTLLPTTLTPTTMPTLPFDDSFMSFRVPNYTLFGSTETIAPLTTTTFNGDLFPIISNSVNITIRKNGIYLLHFVANVEAVPTASLYVTVRLYRNNVLQATVSRTIYKMCSLDLPMIQTVVTTGTVFYFTIQTSGTNVRVVNTLHGIVKIIDLAVLTTFQLNNAQTIPTSNTGTNTFTQLETFGVSAPSITVGGTLTANQPGFYEVHCFITFSRNGVGADLKFQVDNTIYPYTFTDFFIDYETNAGTYLGTMQFKFTRLYALGETKKLYFHSNGSPSPIITSSSCYMRMINNTDYVVAYMGSDLIGPTTFFVPNTTIVPIASNGNTLVLSYVTDIGTITMPANLQAGFYSLYVEGASIYKIQSQQYYSITYSLKRGSVVICDLSIYRYEANMPFNFNCIFSVSPNDVLTMFLEQNTVPIAGLVISSYPNFELIRISNILPATIGPTTLTPTTLQPTRVPTTLQPTTLVPTLVPTTLQPTTRVPTLVPTTLTPTTLQPTTLQPTRVPTTLTPTTLQPTRVPTTLTPTTLQPTRLPTTLTPTTLQPTRLPTTLTPTTLQPTRVPTTLQPTTLVPTLVPTTLTPTTLQPTSLVPTFSAIFDDTFTSFRAILLSSFTTTETAVPLTLINSNGNLSPTIVNSINITIRKDGIYLVHLVVNIQNTPTTSNYITARLYRNNVMQAMVSKAFYVMNSLEIPMMQTFVTTGTVFHFTIQTSAGTAVVINNVQGIVKFIDRPIVTTFRLNMGQTVPVFGVGTNTFTQLETFGVSPPLITTDGIITVNQPGFYEVHCFVAFSRNEVGADMKFQLDNNVYPYTRKDFFIDYETTAGIYTGSLHFKFTRLYSLGETKKLYFHSNGSPSPTITNSSCYIRMINNTDYTVANIISNTATSIAFVVPNSAFISVTTNGIAPILSYVSNSATITMPSSIQPGFYSLSIGGASLYQYTSPYDAVTYSLKRGSTVICDFSMQRYWVNAPFSFHCIFSTTPNDVLSIVRESTLATDYSIPIQSYPNFEIVRVSTLITSQPTRLPTV